MEQHSTNSASKALPSCHIILLEMNHRPQSTLVLFIGTKSNTQGLSITGNIMLRPPSNPFEHLTRSVVRSWPSVSFMRRSKNSIFFFLGESDIEKMGREPENLGKASDLVSV